MPLPRGLPQQQLTKFGNEWCMAAVIFCLNDNWNSRSQGRYEARADLSPAAVGVLSLAEWLLRSSLLATHVFRTAELARVSSKIVG
jgi:hypothetical protein